MRKTLTGIAGFVFTLAFAADTGAAEKTWLGEKPSGEAASEAGPLEKSVADGLILGGPFSYNHPGGSATINISVGHISNNSSSRNSGTLRLELWATLTRPTRGGGLTGYRLAVGPTLAPLSPNFQYNNVSQNPAYVPPPDGTYYMTIILSEYNSVSCRRPDLYCISDSFTFTNTETFGTAPPPPPQLTAGVTTKTLGSRGLVTQGATLYGGFELLAQATVLFLVRGNSLGTLGVTQGYLDAPRVRIFNSVGADLVNQGGFAGVNSCSSANALTDYPVIYYYSVIRQQAVEPRDGCYTATLASGVYTFSITPSIAGVTSSGLVSSPPAGEVLFEVTMFR